MCRDHSSVSRCGAGCCLQSSAEAMGKCRQLSKSVTRSQDNWFVLQTGLGVDFEAASIVGAAVVDTLGNYVPPRQMPGADCMIPLRPI